MKRQQLFLVGGGLALFLLIFFFGKTIPPKKDTSATPMQQAAGNKSISTTEIIATAKQKLNSAQNERLISMENAVIRGDVKEQKIHIYHQLAHYWKDSIHAFEPYAYYTAEAAKLENSEKSLTFAAQLFVDNLIGSNDAPMQNWLATNAKVLLDKVLEINPTNDSAKIGIGACYLFGNISTSPMEGIMKVREIVQKNPNNLYAQLVLGLGGKKSGQYDKAIEHFTVIINKQPGNVEALFQLAECNELKGDKPNAIKWYEALKKQINNDQIKEELDKRIQSLK